MNPTSFVHFVFIPSDLADGCVEDGLGGRTEASEEACCPQLESGFGSVTRTARLTGPRSPCLNQRQAKASLVCVAESPCCGVGLLSWF